MEGLVPQAQVPTLAAAVVARALSVPQHHLAPEALVVQVPHGMARPTQAEVAVPERRPAAQGDPVAAAMAAYWVAPPRQRTAPQIKAAAVVETAQVRLALGVKAS